MEFNMDFYSIAGLAVITAALAVILRQYKPEYAMLVALCGGIIILFIVIIEIGQIYKFAEDVLSKMNVSVSGFEILFKALGVAYISQLSSDICKDANETALASKIELAGRVTIVIMALPLLKLFLELMQKILG